MQLKLKFVLKEGQKTPGCPVCLYSTPTAACFFCCFFFVFFCWTKPVLSRGESSVCRSLRRFQTVWGPDRDCVGLWPPFFLPSNTCVAGFAHRIVCVLWLSHHRRQGGCMNQIALFVLFQCLLVNTSERKPVPPSTARALHDSAAATRCRFRVLDHFPELRLSWRHCLRTVLPNILMFSASCSASSVKSC